MKALGVLFLLLSLISTAHADGAWKGEIPKQAQDPKAWSALLAELRQNGMPYGAMAASARMLTFFNELPVKETAYQAVIELVDQGYPFPTGALFIPGDLEARGDSGFVNSYNLMKYVLNHEKGMDRWAKQYYDKLGSESFPKYQFYLAIQSYAQGTPEGLNLAVERLRKILVTDKGQGSGALAIKSARTLARIYFERKQYDKSLDIYRSFLLKMNPVHPSDWLEAAWNEYYLKNYSEALGMVYNLESRAASREVSLEKYTLRALIYRENCAVQSAQAMIGSFDRDFGAALEGLKQGESPRKYPILSRVETGRGSSALQLIAAIDDLHGESTHIQKKLPEAIRPLAQYLYESEDKMLQMELKSASEIASNAAAELLVTTSEQLKFMKYDVARQKYNPDEVFTQTSAHPMDSAMGSAMDSMDAPSPSPAEGFKVNWPQQGDFWRNERLSFKGRITSQCNN